MPAANSAGRALLLSTALAGRLSQDCDDIFWIICKGQVWSWGQLPCSSSCARGAMRRGCWAADMSLETILLNCSNKGSSIPLQQKELDWWRLAIWGLRDSVNFNWSNQRGLWRAIPAGAVWAQRQQVGAVCWGPAQPFMQSSTDLHGDYCSTPGRDDFLFSGGRKMLQNQIPPNICSVSCPSRLSCHPQPLPWSPTVCCYGRATEM